MSEAQARREDPETSHAAAESLTPEALGFLKQGILNVLKLVWPRGLTTFEIAEAMESDRDSISPRMASLEAAGLVVNSGEKRVPEGRTRAAIVWRAVREGDTKEEANFEADLADDLERRTYQYQAEGTVATVNHPVEVAFGVIGRDAPETEAEFLARLPADDDIDLSDAPEATEEWFAKAKVQPPKAAPAERPMVEVSPEDITHLRKKANGRALHMAFRDGRAFLKRGDDGKTMSAWAITELSTLHGGRVVD